MKSKIRKYRSLDKSEKKLLLEALFLSYLIWIIHFFYKYNRLEKKYACTGMEQNAPEVSKNIKIAILRSSKLTFWKNQCLIQAFVARRMLNRRNTSSKAYLGLIQVEKSRYIAHAWIEASGIEVVKGTPGCIKVHEF